jgi:hypothetical protein
MAMVHATSSEVDDAVARAEAMCVELQDVLDKGLDQDAIASGLEEVRGRG